MVEPTRQAKAEKGRADPGVSADSQTNQAGFDAHIWTSLNQIFERLGKIDQKVDQLSTDHRELKVSVEKHDKLITRAIFTVGGAIAVILALWFIYENFLKNHIVIQ